MGVLDEILNRRRGIAQQAVRNVQQKPATLQEAATSPAVQPALATANRLAQQSEQKRAAAAQGAADAAREQQWMTGQRRVNGDGQQYVQDGGQFAASPDRATRHMTPGVAVPGLTTTQPQPTGQVATQPAAQPQVTDLAGLTEALERTKRAVDEATESEEDKKAREKREKRQALMAKIGDGLSAFHEAYSYMRGTKPMTSGSLTAAQEARVKALGLERDAKYKNALDNYLKVLEMQRKEDYYNSIAETRRAQQESLDRDRAEKRKETARVNDARVALYNARKGKLIDDSVFNAEYERAITSGLDEATAINTALNAAKAQQDALAQQQQAESDAKVKAGEAQANQRNAAANASNARAAKTRAGGSAGGGDTTTTQTKVVYDRNGNVKGRTETTTTKKKGSGGGNKKPSSSKGNNGNGKKQTGLQGQWKK